MNGGVPVARTPLSSTIWLMDTVAVIGASNDRSKFGNKAVRGFTGKGWKVYPVNPHEAVIEGIKAYASITDLPERPRLVSVYVQPSVLLKLLPAIAERGCDELWLNPGADTPEAVAEARRLGLHVIQACSLVGHGISPEAL